MPIHTVPRIYSCLGQVGTETVNKRYFAGSSFGWFVRLVVLLQGFRATADSHAAAPVGMRLLLFLWQQAYLVKECPKLGDLKLKTGLDVLYESALV